MKFEGDVNYIFTVILKSLFTEKGCGYQERGDAIKALEMAKLEFYRMDCAPYEDEKIKQNGIVSALPNRRKEEEEVTG